MGKDIIFYDGLCALCHGTVRFVAARDREARYLFAPLQGKTAAKKLPKQGLPDSLVMLEGGKMLLKAGAILAIGRSLGQPWKAMAAMAAVVPTGLLDLAYDAVARLRRPIFGRNDTCPLPPLEWKDRFLN